MQLSTGIVDFYACAGMLNLSKMLFLLQRSLLRETFSIKSFTSAQDQAATSRRLPDCLVPSNSRQWGQKTQMWQVIQTGHSLSNLTQHVPVSIVSLSYFPYCIAYFITRLYNFFFVFILRSVFLVLCRTVISIITHQHGFA